MTTGMSSRSRTRSQSRRLCDGSGATTATVERNSMFPTRSLPVGRHSGTLAQARFFSPTAVAIPNTAPPAASARRSRPPRLRLRSRSIASPSCRLVVASLESYGVNGDVKSGTRPQRESGRASENAPPGASLAGPPLGGRHAAVGVPITLRLVLAPVLDVPLKMGGDGDTGPGGPGHDGTRQLICCVKFVTVLPVRLPV
jgi:hypothetical protein